MTIPAAGAGRLTRIASGSNLGAPRLSGDGKVVVWTEWVDNQWEVMRHAEGKTLCITKDPRHDIEPRLNHDGSVVVWSRLNTEGGQPNWDVMQWRNGEVSVVAGSSADEYQPSVSPDGETVVYVRDDVNEPVGFDLHRWRQGKVEVVTDGGPVDTEPVVAKEGDWVYFRRKVKFDGGDLWLSDHRGNAKACTDNPVPEFDPVATPDGRSLIWSQDDQGDHDLYRWQPDGGRITLLLGERGVDELYPSVSADGNLVAFTRQEPGGDAQVCLLQDGKVQPVTSQGSNAWPQISHDGKTLAWWGYDEKTKETSIYRLEREP